jgi:hypothetical protein
MTRSIALLAPQQDYARAASAAPAASLCAGHAQQLGGESPLPDPMEVRARDDARATAARRGLKEAWIKHASRWTKTGYKAQVPDEWATYREVRIHQRCKA